MMVEAHQSVARRVMLKAFLSSDHVSPATGKTIAVVISKNGGAFGNPSAGATNATEVSVGWYYVDLSTTDFGTLGDLVVRGTEGTIDAVERGFAVVAATNRGMTALPAAAADAAGGLVISDAGGLDIDAVGAAVTSGTHGNAALKTLIDTVDNILDTEFPALVTLIGTPSNLGTGATVAANLSDIHGYVDDIVNLPTAAQIADAVLDEDMTAHQTQGTLGKTIGDPGNDSTTIWGVIDALAVPSADDVANAVWDEPTSGHTTSGTFGEQAKTDIDAILAAVDTEVAATLAAVDTEIAAIQTTLAALFTTAITEPTYRTDGAAGSLAQLIYEINQTIGERSFAGVTGTVKKIDGTTTAFTQTINSASIAYQLTHPGLQPC